MTRTQFEATEHTLHAARRSSPRLLVALLTVVALGLASRSGHEAVPAWIARNAGDALWTVAVYIVLAFSLRRSSARWLFVLALLISLLVELSQLNHAAWLEELRSSTPGRLLLGTGWQWLDLPRYAAGAFAAWGLDRVGSFSVGRRAA